MAGYGWGLRSHGSLQGLNHQARPSPCPPTQIACRICDQVFMSTHALINHIESHISEEETFSTRPRHDLSFLANSLQPTFPLQRETQLPLPDPYSSPFLRERSLSLALGPQSVTPPRPRRPPPASSSSPLSLFARTSLTLGQTCPDSGQHPQEHRVMQEPPPSDCTKPFLRLLERTQPEKIDLREGHEREDDNNGPDSNSLDLTLKL